ncbi:MAG: helix-turn-helix domain-containing protein [Candidatus Gracilibacteria bacterium]
MLNEYSFLEKMGLHKNEVKLYLQGLAIGTQATSVFAKKTGLPRSTTQLYLQNLVKLGFMSKTLRAGVQYFTPFPPSEIENIIDSKKEELNVIGNTLTNMLPLLKSHQNTDYNMSRMTVFEGKLGVQKLFKDIVATGKEVLVFKSPLYHFDNPALRKMTESFMLELKRNEIPVRALTPKAKKHSAEYSISQAEYYGFQRRFIEMDIYELPCQIFAYGDKLGIITNDSEIQCVVIQEKFLTTLMYRQFEYLWSAALPYHKKVLKDDDLEKHEEPYRKFIHPEE